MQPIDCLVYAVIAPYVERVYIYLRPRTFLFFVHSFESIKLSEVYFALSISQCSPHLDFRLAYTPASLSFIMRFALSAILVAAASAVFALPTRRDGPSDTDILNYALTLGE